MKGIWKNRPRNLSGHIHQGYTFDRLRNKAINTPRKIVPLAPKCWCGEIHGKTDRDSVGNPIAG